MKFQLTFTLVYMWYLAWKGKQKMYFYCAAHKSGTSLSETELAVYILTDSLKMNAEGGEEEQLAYKMYPFTCSDCL